MNLFEQKAIVFRTPKQEYDRKRYQERKERTREARVLANRTINRRWRRNHPEHARLIQVKYRLRNRIELVQLLGGKCASCGFSDSRALQIDHVNGGGRREFRAKDAYRYYRDIYYQVLSGSKEYQLLCANCNWIKRFTQHERRTLYPTNKEVHVD